MPPTFDFQPHTTFYQPQNAYWLAKASQLVYTRKAEKDASPDDTAISNEMKAWDPGFVEVTTFDNKSSQAFIAKHEKFVIIAFRGTDEKADWADNLKMNSVDFPHGKGVERLGKVHSGFYQAFLDVWDPQGKARETLKNNSLKNTSMKELLERDDYKTLPFWITGHSLGGAMASMCAFNFIYEDIPFYGAYTYGQPRTCNRSLMRHFNAEAKDRYFRFQNNNDIVSRIPQRLAGYSHIGTFLYIDTETNLSTDMGFWFQFADRVEGAVEYLAQLQGGVFRDHMIGDYIEAMENNIDFTPKNLAR